MSKYPASVQSCGRETTPFRWEGQSHTLFMKVASSVSNLSSADLVFHVGHHFVVLRMSRSSGGSRRPSGRPWEPEAQFPFLRHRNEPGKGREIYEGVGVVKKRRDIRKCACSLVFRLAAGTKIFNSRQVHLGTRA